MVFLPHSWAGNLPYPPDDVSICDFMLNEKSGRLPFSNSRDPFTCGISGRTYSTAQVAQRVEALARALAKEFGWHPNKGSEWEKVVAIYSFNSVSCAILGFPDALMDGEINAAFATARLISFLSAGPSTGAPVLPLQQMRSTPHRNSPIS